MKINVCCHPKWDLPKTLGSVVMSAALLFTLAGFARQAGPAQSPILYDTLADSATLEEAVRLGAVPVLLIYQSVDPESVKTGQIDIAKVLSAIERMTAGNPPEWGLLDFEDPFFQWLDMAPDSPEFLKATSMLVRLLEIVRRAYPGTKWALYGIPMLPYWDHGLSWDVMDEESKRRLLHRCAVATQKIVEASDWVCPSVYMFYDPAMFTEENRPGVQLAGRVWRSATVRIAKLLAGKRPVIPVTSPLWTEVGRAPAGAIVPKDQFKVDGLQPGGAAGADGIAIWTALGYKVNRVTSQDCPPDERRSILRSLDPDQANADGQHQLPDSSALRRAAGQVIINSIREARAALSTKGTVAP
jgi:hypothetical protein